MQTEINAQSGQLLCVCVCVCVRPRGIVVVAEASKSANQASTVLLPNMLLLSPDATENRYTHQADTDLLVKVRHQPGSNLFPPSVVTVLLLSRKKSPRETRHNALNLNVT